MNNNHLQETVRYYAQLAEQARVDLQEADELNEELLGLIDALCEELGVDTEEMLQTEGILKNIWNTLRHGNSEGSAAAEAKSIKSNTTAERDKERIASVGRPITKPKVTPPEWVPDAEAITKWRARAFGK